MEAADMRVRFERIERWATKRVKCAGCGKSMERSKTFWQTLNPWNVHPDGTPRTREQIYDHLGYEIKAWRLQPEYHAQCQS